MGRYVSLRNRVQAVGLTDTGKVREHNEDSIALDGDIGLFVLADGMGGYNAGEVASGIAVKTITNLVREAFVGQELDGNDKTTGLHRPSIILRDAIARANKIIHQTSKSQTQCEGMGTTVVAALLHDNRISIAREIVKGAGLPNCGLLLDTYHMHFGGAPGRGFEQVPAEEIMAFQFSDAPPGAAAQGATATDRLPPGKGVVDWKGVFGLLAEKDYRGYIMYEAPNPAQWSRPPEEVAREGITAARELIASVLKS